MYKCIYIFDALTFIQVIRERVECDILGQITLNLIMHTANFMIMNANFIEKIIVNNIIFC